MSATRRNVSARLTLLRGDVVVNRFGERQVEAAKRHRQRQRQRGNHDGHHPGCDLLLSVASGLRARAWRSRTAGRRALPFPIFIRLRPGRLTTADRDAGDAGPGGHLADALAERLLAAQVALAERLKAAVDRAQAGLERAEPSLV